MIDVSEIKQAIENKDVDKIKHLMSLHNLKIIDGKIIASAEQIKDSRAYWDKRQLVKKIGLNSLYGALLNSHMRFYDKRIGQSVTLCGRQIIKHMMSTINECVTGEYVHDGSSIIYGDTDSAIFTAYHKLKNDIDNGSINWNKETAIKLYDAIADQVNSSFPQFMERAFHAPPKNGAIIKAGRELVGDRALFIKKKKYAINIYDKEGKRLDVDGRPGKIKAMGLDLKRSDTPKYVQEFLTGVLERVLAGKNRDEIVATVKDFKTELSQKPSWEKGSPRATNKLTWYAELEEKSPTGRANMPGHVRAALNWNFLRRMNGDNYSMRIVDGMKVVVCKLRSNALNFTSIAYPVDELRLPAWFKDLPFDDATMENLLVDQKLDNLIGILKWDFKQDINIKSSFNDLFTFE
jgi:DNA polymerase elongation subunit (family B)